MFTATIGLIIATGLLAWAVLHSPKTVRQAAKNQQSAGSKPADCTPDALVITNVRWFLAG
jgi:hypothetical protein